MYDSITAILKPEVGVLHISEHEILRITVSQNIVGEDLDEHLIGYCF